MTGALSWLKPSLRAVYLTPDATYAMAMVMHELATNAARYGGALSQPQGRVTVHWTLPPDIPSAALKIQWEKSADLRVPSLPHQH